MNFQTIKSLPKVELHTHLDGSISLITLKKLAKIANKSLPPDEEVIRNLHVLANCQSLASYLKCFEVVMPFLQSEEALKTAAYDLIAQAADENIVYIEVRFAPMLFILEGLSVDEIIKSVADGLKQGYLGYGVRSNMILCAMRGHDLETNKRVIDYAVMYRKIGVVGVDLAGDEAAYPPKIYLEWFNYAKEKGINLTVHAGECGSAENISDSIAFGAKRIGHGTSMRGHRDLIDTCILHNIHIEMCPTSNLQTKAISNMKEYPFQAFYNAGLSISVNTDNRSVSGTTLTNEWQALQVTTEIIHKITLEALLSSFATEEEKQLIANEITLVNQERRNDERSNPIFKRTGD
ncbi:putative adenosine deaminase [Listeria monocytogenes]|uniref:adenosine deaminase n=1 Tax=Listeria monocytogenes TaxID=1639 RepID=UPI000A1D52B2|nr:adenosine deaminase [Listeria monocytogenes]ARM74503.1 putative adenosine deaminase [Listeria monocytogenes]